MSKLMSRFVVLVAQKEIRDGRRYSQTQIAKETGLSPSTISRMMAGDINSASLQTVLTLSDWLDCEIGDLVYKEREVS